MYHSQGNRSFAGSPRFASNPGSVLLSAPKRDPAGTESAQARRRWRDTASRTFFVSPNEEWTWLMKELDLPAKRENGSWGSSRQSS